MWTFLALHITSPHGTLTAFTRAPLVLSFKLLKYPCVLDPNEDVTGEKSLHLLYDLFAVLPPATWTCGLPSGGQHTNSTCYYSHLVLLSPQSTVYFPILHGVISYLTIKGFQRQKLFLTWAPCCSASRLVMTSQLADLTPPYVESALHHPVGNGLPLTKMPVKVLMEDWGCPFFASGLNVQNTRDDTSL